MSAREGASRLIFILFLISVGALELILAHDRKGGASRRNARGNDSTRDLISLMNAIRREGSGMRPQFEPSQDETHQIEVVKQEREYNRESGGGR